MDVRAIRLREKNNWITSPGWVLEFSLLRSLQGGQSSTYVPSIYHAFHIHKRCNGFNEPLMQQASLEPFKL